LVDKAMQDGAFGLSSGLLYIPGNFAAPDELQKLAAVAHQYGGFYASHMRFRRLSCITSSSRNY